MKTIVRYLRFVRLVLRYPALFFLLTLSTPLVDGSWHPCQLHAAMGAAWRIEATYCPNDDSATLLASCADQLAALSR